MMAEASKRGHAIHAIQQHDLALEDGQVTANTQHITLAGDATQWYRAEEPQTVRLTEFDAVILRKDPPFDAGLFEPALTAALPCVVAQGWIYLEAPAPFEAAPLAARGLERYRHARAGAVHAHLLRKL